MANLITKFWAQARRHPVILTLGMIALLAELGYATLNQSGLPPYVDKELHLGAGWLGWIMATFLLVESLARPGLGALGDRIGRRPLLVAGPIASCAAALLMMRAVHPGSILALRVLDGLGAAAIWPTAFALVGDSVDEENRSTAMSVLNVTYMAGIALGPLLGGIIADRTGTQHYVFLAVGIIFALTFVVALLRLPKRESHHEHGPDCPDHQAEYHLSDLLFSLKAIPHMLAMVFFAFLAIGLLIPIVKLYATQELKLSETGFGTMLLPVAAILAVLAVPMGRLGDTWGKTKAVRTGISLTALAMWMMASLKMVPSLIIAGSLLGIGFLMAMPSWLALISELTSSNNRGQVLGAVGMAQGLGAILGAVLGGHLYDLTHSFCGIEAHSAPLFLSAALLTVSAALAFVFLRSAKQVEGKQVE